MKGVSRFIRLEKLSAPHYKIFTHLIPNLPLLVISNKLSTEKRVKILHLLQQENAQSKTRNKNFNLFFLMLYFSVQS